MRAVARGLDTGKITPAELVERWPNIGLAVMRNSCDELR